MNIGNKRTKHKSADAPPPPVLWACFFQAGTLRVFDDYGHAALCRQYPTTTHLAKYELCADDDTLGHNNTAAP